MSGAMSNVKIISLILVFLQGGLMETDALSVTGVLGEEVTIKCTHANAISNVKYFCKGPCQNKDVLISSQNNVEDSNEKYRIKDEGNTFEVTISHLTEHDSGTYWCGIDRIGVDTFTEVVLTVIKGSTKDPGLNSNASFSKKLVYTGAGLGVVLLALAMVLLIFFRHQNRNIHAAFEKDHDTVYAAPSSQKGSEGHHIATSPPTANEDQETNSRTKNTLSSSTVQHRDGKADHSDNIYSNVTVSAASQPDGLFYSTVSFSKHTGSSSAVTARTAAPTYSSIKHTATDESTVYDNI